MEMTTRCAHRPSSRHLFIGGSDARIIMGADEGTNNHDACRVRHWGEKTRKPERAPPENLNQHWYPAMTGGMPLQWYIVAVCYATIVILLGWYPWNILLMCFRCRAMNFPRRDQTARPVDTGHYDER